LYWAICLGREEIEELARREELKRKERKGTKRKSGSDLFQTLEEVFDNRTVMSLYQLINRGYIEGMRGVVKAGKESRIYWAKGTKGEDLAVKIYLTSSAEFRKSMLQYIHGDPRFKVGRDHRLMVYTWAQKEYKNLVEAARAGVRVPKPIYVYENILIMEFIGEDGVPAPLLRDLPGGEVTADLYREVAEEVDKLYRTAGLVHADLSEYNIMVPGPGSVTLIDFGQAVTKEHPMADDFLKRDVANVIRFFRRAGAEVPQEESVIEWLKRE